MICVSLAEKSTARILAALPRHPFAEIRLDAVEDLSREGIGEIFRRHRRLIATHRPGRVPELERIDRLAAAASAGAAYVDLEFGMAKAGFEKIRRSARSRGCRLIVSYHDETGTPPRAFLRSVLRRGFLAGADLVKVACKSEGPGDNARLLGLLDDPRPVLAIGMGPAGKLTRLLAPFLGAPFTYASPVRGKETAEGQIEADTIRRIWEVWEHV